MLNTKGIDRMGWIPDYPDFRDYTEKTEEVRLTLGSAAVSKGKSLPASVQEAMVAVGMPVTRQSPAQILRERLSHTTPTVMKRGCS